MNSRRNFFKQFVGQFLVMKDEVTGKQNIPLNKLHELPDNIVKKIVPVFFEDTNWLKQNGAIVFPDLNKQLDLQPIDEFIFQQFQRKFSIKKTTTLLMQHHQLSQEESYSKVSQLFFKLGRCRVCHPQEDLNISELISNA